MFFRHAQIKTAKSCLYVRNFRVMFLGDSSASNRSDSAQAVPNWTEGIARAHLQMHWTRVEGLVLIKMKCKGDDYELLNRVTWDSVLDMPQFAARPVIGVEGYAEYAVSLATGYTHPTKKRRAY